MSLHGAVRGKKLRTTIPDTNAVCPLDHVKRQFKANRPNKLWVSDLAYVSTWQGWLYVAFVIDVYVRAGASAGPCGLTSSSMRLSKPCTTDCPTAMH